MMDQVIADDAAAHRPADEHGPVQVKGVDDACEVVGPALAVLVEFRAVGFVQLPVATHIEGDDAEIVDQIAAQLANEGQMALRLAVDEQERVTGGIAPFLDGEAYTIGADGLRGAARFEVSRSCRDLYP